ncbi:protein transport protein sec24 [Hordeum vulgare]|nr:protein transport protein sec24 [Hordeum vulgare]
MSQGPWLFRNMAVIFAPYDGYSEAMDVLMVHMPIWLQIHKLPDGYCRVDVVEKLLRSSGEILETRIAGNSRGDYIRVRVKHDVRKPLTKFVSIVKGKVRSVYAVRYEKLARFCKACGIIGHDHKECGNGVYVESDLKFGDYLYADPSGKFKSDWEPSRPDKPVPVSPAAKVPTDKGVAAIDRELKDTASSPVKKDTSLAMEVDKSARKRLLVEQDEVVVHAQEGKLLLLTDGKEAANLESPATNSDSKRAKKDDACPHAANLWDTMRLYWPLPDRVHINYTGKEWLFTLLDEAQVSVRSRIIMVLWRSWYVRNEIIHGKTPPPQDVSSAFLQSYHNTFSQISSSVEDIIKGKSPLVPDQASPPCKVAPSLPWPRPPEGMVALSVDGSYAISDGSAGTGMILRKPSGEVIFAAYRKLFHCNDALEAELQAIHEGVKLAAEHSEATIMLRSDCVMAINAITGVSLDFSAYGNMIRDIKFWLDPWLDEEPLRLRFPSLFAICDDPVVLLSEAALEDGWHFAFRHSLGSAEVQDWEALKAVVPLPDSSVNDSVSWSLSPSREFSVSSAYLELCRVPVLPWLSPLWKASLPLKIKIFVWQILRDRLPSGTEVLKRHGPGNGTCPLCHVPETGTHILFSCVAAHALWCFVREALGPEWEAHDLAEFLQRVSRDTRSPLPEPNDGDVRSENISQSESEELGAVVAKVESPASPGMRPAGPVAMLSSSVDDVRCCSSGSEECDPSAPLCSDWDYFGNCYFDHLGEFFDFEDIPMYV